MALSGRAVTLVSCLTLLACSGGGGRSAKQLGQDASAEGDSSSVKGPDTPIRGGDQVDLDGDGTADGVAIDADGDGSAEGVDTDGDGTIDQPLPTGDAGGVVTGTPFPTDATGAVLCGTAPCACNDGLDNDKDAVSDLADPECVSSWDNDEGSFATGIPGDNRDLACQDCFFDGNSGSGNDGCRLPTSCLTTGQVAKEDSHGKCSSCEQTAQCKNFCQAYTPNGCDCFGCCDVRIGDQLKHVLLQEGCNIDGTKLENCNECVPSTTCVNTCGRCELCPGKTINDLPADCASGGDDAGTGGDTDGGITNPPPPTYTCDGGEQRCGSGLPTCADGALCQFGCCMLAPILI